MITLATIPARYHEALAAERVDVTDGVGRGVMMVCADGTACVFAQGVPVYAAADRLTLPPTERNVRALAVVLAQACGLDVSGGVVARYHSTQTMELRLEGPCALWGVANLPALATIDPTAPDALFRALCACLCALETA